MSKLEFILPYLRVATALAPFLAALAIRFLIGRNRFTRFIISAATTWFAVNVLLAPFTDVSRFTDWLR